MKGTKEKIMNYIIKWENKYSHETGYVGKVNYEEKYFESCTDKDECLVFSTKRIANRTVKDLIAFGEAENNILTVEPLR